MKTKECPSCGADVPTVAYRCKHCFHDFDEKPKGGSWAGPIALLFALAGMAVVAALAAIFVLTRPIEERILVDQDTRSVIWTTQYRTGVSTDRLLFDDIAKLEYVSQRSGTYAIRAVTRDGSEWIIQSAGTPLRSEANQYSQLMAKELVVVDETTGFHKMGQ